MGRGKETVPREKIARIERKGRPVLVGTVSIEKSERLVRTCWRSAAFEHEVLNAKFHKREADIVAQAGRKGAVTIATNMAGRGTDIVLGGNPETMAWARCRTNTETRLEVPPRRVGRAGRARSIARGEHGGRGGGGRDSAGCT